MRTIYESDSVILAQDRPVVPGVPTIVSFSSYTNQSANFDYFAARFLKTLPVNGLYVVAKKSVWWQFDELPDLIEAARATLAGRSGEIVTYGSSMGGYGALLLACDLRAKRAVVASPQTTITQPHVPLKNAWRQIIDVRPVVKDDIHLTLSSGIEVLAIFDPLHPHDRLHLKYLEQCMAGNPRALGRYITPFAGHAALGYLRNIDVLRDVISAMLLGHISPSDFRRLVRERGRQDATYCQHLQMYLTKRNPLPMARTC
jgi:pimeloyl-ACP methyl ester carboxylesterase